jgi:hypothetical protein
VVGRDSMLMRFHFNGKRERWVATNTRALRVRVGGVRVGG